MDQSVLDAVKRWPDVPAVYGWLSLTARGQWRLHPIGDAQQGGPGQGISNIQILGFMDRNYGAESDGAWFFQNGPQRVYVRLDAAPLIVHVDPALHILKTHDGRIVEKITHWFCDESGLLYAQTDCGPARIDDRDLPVLAEVLRTPDRDTILELFDAFERRQTQHHAGVIHESSMHTLCDPTQQFNACREAAPLCFLRATEVAQMLHFIPNPGLTTAPLSTDFDRKIHV